MTFTKHDLKIGIHLYWERGELLDDALYAELNNRDFSKVKSDRLEEINEQIRLIETITNGAQDEYFGKVAEYPLTFSGGEVAEARPYHAGNYTDEIPF